MHLSYFVFSEKYRNLPVPTFGPNFTANQTASQFRTIVTRFGFICGLVSPKLPRAFFASENFDVFTRFSKIISYLNSPVLLRYDTMVLEGLVSRFLNGYAKLYGSSEIKNKFHHLLHYPSAIAGFGPSLYTNTMLHERTLRKIKPMIRGRKNIIKQISTAAAFQTYWYLETLEKSQDTPIAGGKLYFLNAKSSSSHLKKTLSSLDQNIANQIPSNASIHKSIRHRGSFYFQGGAVCLAIIENGWLSDSIATATIELVYSYENQVFLVLRNMVFKCYQPNMVAIEVKHSNDKPYIINASSLSVQRSFSIKTVICDNTVKTFVILDSLPYKLYFKD